MENLASINCRVATPETSSRANPPPLQKLTRLLSGRSVPAEMYDFVHDFAKNFLQNHHGSKPFTCRQMFGEKIWKTLEGSEPELLGECMADLAKRGVLPFRSHGKNSKNALLYVRF